LYETPDAELEAELERDFAGLETDFKRERTALLFAGEYDERPALLSISAGAGGTEATDWTEMLLRMYLRWAERHRFPTEILDQQEGEQAGLKSVTVAVNGRRAYGWLHVMLAGSAWEAGDRRRLLRHAMAAVRAQPSVALRFLGYPWRRIRRAFRRG